MTGPERVANARWIGMFLIWSVQMIGTPAIAVRSLFGLFGSEENPVKWSTWYPSLSDWTYDRTLPKFLGTMMLGLFWVNGMFVLAEESQSWIKIDRMFRYYDLSKKGMREWMLAIGAVTNCWCVAWTCVDSYLVLVSAGTVKDVLFDALGLAFLYNLDDIGGDMGFVNNDDWPGLQLSWLYTRMVDSMKEEIRKRKEDPNMEVTEEDVEGLFRETRDTESAFVMRLFWLTMWLLTVGSVIAPIFCILTPFEAMAAAYNPQA
eukprot:gnl/TRDRNA2_/TRDRNA2_143267_c1_seq1.p1 gnl/TRDRNA2_/TRDRNA2_143267_c1~~gnl/TRDRNA2_/TRDRNA2_143267_c1_seq1.p1  ORF type:complete len:276 (+),score=26.57 gnl/TRDRNA2_/TRDRNA2_143267_c1_seq1:48-830(+)